MKGANREVRPFCVLWEDMPEDNLREQHFSKAIPLPAKVEPAMLNIADVRKVRARG